MSNIKNKFGILENGLQELVNTQVCVNRCVWAGNTLENASSLEWNDQKRKEYIVQNARSAIIHLQEALKQIENTLF